MVKAPITFNFAKGLDLKTDPKQVAFDSFLVFENAVFDTGGLLKKRNGYGSIAALPSANYSFLTTLNDNLTAIGPAVSALVEGTGAWTNKGAYPACKLNTLPLVRTSVDQTQCDSAIAPNGLICTVFTQTNGGTSTCWYVIADSVTGQNVVVPTQIPAVSGGTLVGSPRVFLSQQMFVIAFTNEISATYHLQYTAISSQNPSVASTPVDITSSYTPAATVAWDGITDTGTGNIFFAYNTLSGGQKIVVQLLTRGEILTGMTPGTTPLNYTGSNDKASMFALAIIPGVQVFIAWYYAAAANYYVASADITGGTSLWGPTAITTSSKTFLNLAATVQGANFILFSEVSNNYSYDSSIPTHYVQKIPVSFAGSVGSPSLVIRSLGLASKAFTIDGGAYFLGAYETYPTSYQNAYFLVNGTTSTPANPQITAKLAYTNGGGYLPTGLPSVTASGLVAQLPYLVKDLALPLAVNPNASQQTTTGGVYSQLGVNLVTFDLGTTDIGTVEIAGNLNFGGGFLWQYDGLRPVENNFFLYPDSVEATWSTSGGSMYAKPDGSTNTDAYYYSVTYEWTDNQGNVYRSTPSIPISVTTSGSGTTGSVTVNIPTLRLTYKTATDSIPSLVVYRWSVAQQTYYQVTSVSAALLNDPTVDSIAFVDTLADSSIVGNNILYTTGGVVEDISGPSTSIFTLFDTRLWIVDAEDPNRLWYSKTVIEATPVEMSDLFTYYVAPTTAAQGPTGPVTALAPMDDKLIIGKKNAMYYLNGSGPDNTGNQSQYSPAPIFITATVGCDNQRSWVFTPNGLMFQSNNKGIWLLGRDLSTQYIGAPVEAFNNSRVTSAVNVPETNQVRFTLDTGETLMYDYYYGQWGTFAAVPAVSSTIYQDRHTFINSLGSALQETPDSYMDASNPVNMRFQTSWLKLAGLQGYQRAFFFYLLGQYLSPHTLIVDIEYDYQEGAQQTVVINPTNFTPVYGGNGADIENPYGNQSPYGGPGDLEQWRIFFKKQRCEAIRLTVREIYDNTKGQPAGAGFTMSGLMGIFGFKSTFRTMNPKNSVG